MISDFEPVEPRIYSFCYTKDAQRNTRKVWGGGHPGKYYFEIYEKHVLKMSEHACTQLFNF